MKSYEAYIAAAIRSLKLAAKALHEDAREVYLADALLHVTRALEQEAPK